MSNNAIEYRQEDFSEFLSEEQKPAKEMEIVDEPKDLVVIPDIVPQEIFKPSGSDSLLNKIEADFKSIILDPSTEKGRKQIASVAYQVARTKTLLDESGKELGDGYMKAKAAIDEERRKIRSRLDALKEEIRKPLTEYEQREKARVQERTDRIQMMISILSEIHSDPSVSFAETMEAKLKDLSSFDWHEFHSVAEQKYIEVQQEIKRTITERKKRDEDAAELERLRAEALKREQEERDARIAAEAAEKARQEAEAEAQKELDRLEREKREAAERAEAAEKARVEAEERAQREAKEAAEAAERDKRAAVEAEKQRAEKERLDREAQEAKRAADIEHKKKINNEALSAIAGLIEAADESTADTQGLAKAIVEAIAKGNIPHVTIRY